MLHTDLTKSVSCIISHETIELFRWLIKNNTAELKHIIKKTLHKGFFTKLCNTHQSEPQSSEETHAVITDFFECIESLLLESFNEHTQQQFKESYIQDIITQIDTTICDSTTIQASIEKIATQIQKKSKKESKKRLFDEILKQWEPQKEDSLN